MTDLTTGEALRSPAFWIFALSSSLFGLVYSGISLFNESILVRARLQRVASITTFWSSARCSGCWRISEADGWRRRCPIQRLSGFGMAALAVALVLLPLVRTYTHVLIYGAIMGIAGGVVTVVFFSVWGQVFGRAHLGRIQGCAQMMTVFASAVGPLLLAETLRSTGSYDFIFNLLAVLTVAAGSRRPGSSRYPFAIWPMNPIE